MVHLTPIEETVAGREWIQQGMLEGTRESLLVVLEVRFGGAPEPVRTVIAGLKERDVVQALYRRALQAESLADFERALNRRD